VKFLIGDWGFKRIGTLDIRKEETPKTQIESGKSHRHVGGRDRVKKGPVDWVFHRDSLGSPKSRFGSEGNTERSLKTGRSGAETLQGM
jgi:hypothetical protein